MMGQRFADSVGAQIFKTIALPIIGIVVLIMGFAFGVGWLARNYGEQPVHITTAEYRYLCDVAFGEMKWIKGMPLCFVNLEKHMPKGDP